MEGGLNDATQGVPFATSAAAMTAGIGYCVAAKIPCIILTTTPFYGATFGIPTYQAPVAAINAWIYEYALGLGAIVADTYAALGDGSTPYPFMQTQYSNTATGSAGDGEHPGPLGHWELGNIVGATLLSVINNRQQIVNWGALPNLCPNPLNTGAGTVPTGVTYANLAGAASVQSIINDTSGFLPAGRWAQMDATAGAGAYSFNTLNYPVASSGWSIGDVLAFQAYVQINDLSGTYLNDCFNNLSYCDVGLSRNGVIQTGEFILGPNSGPNLVIYTVASGTSSLGSFIQTRTNESKEVQYRIGDLAVYNLTRLGLTHIIT